MSVNRDELLLMARALKRGFVDARGLRKALDRQASKPVSLPEALHLSSPETDALRGDASLPDPVKDRLVLDALQETLLSGEDLSPAEWDRFVASLARPAEKLSYPPLAVPQEFDGYTLQWELARRERGVVYRAHDREGRDVAIKVFRKDVPIAADLPKVDGHPYVVSEFVEGESLESRKLSLRRAVQAVERAARTLRNRPHGALTPARIVVRKDESVAVLGWEAARAVHAGAGDLHALGAILYDLIVGMPPAPGETLPSARTRQVDPVLDRVVSGALSGGYSTVEAFADDLAHWLQGEPVTMRRETPVARRSRKWTWAAAAAVPLVAWIVWAATRGGKPANPGPPVTKEAPAPKGEPAKPPVANPVAAKPKLKPKPEPVKPKEPLKPLTRDDELQLQEDCSKALGEENHDRIIALASEAIERGSKKDWPYYYLAGAYEARNELDKSLEYIERALQRAPENRDYLEMRAQVYAFRGQAAKSLADFSALYGKSGAELNKQILQLNTQLQVASTDGRARTLRGVFYYMKRNFEKAADDFDAAVRGGQRRALVWRARSRLGLDDRVKALEDAKTYLAEFPADFATEEVKILVRDLAGP